MKTTKLLAIAAAAAAALIPGLARADVTVAKGEDFQLNTGIVTQALGFGQQLSDPYTNDARMYLFMKEARIRGNGSYQDIKFHVEMGLGGTEAIAATSGVTLGLLDLNVDLPLSFLGKDASVRIGQFKVPYGREALTYSGYSQFIDRSIDDLGFRIGRDVGVALTVKPGPFTFIGGVFTGGGRDVPPDHYLPERIGVPQVVARLGIGDVDDDPYELRNDTQVEGTKAAFFVNGMYTKDSTVGHSSVLNVKLIDKSLLLNGNWNPYIGKSPLSQGSWWQMGADAALRTRLATELTASAEAEVNWAGYSNNYGELHMAGGRVQAGLTWKKVELALRYAVLFPDQHFASGGVAVTGTKPMQQVTPSATYYLKGQNLKVVADLPVLINTPVITEKNIGSYVGVELPDQTAVLAKGGTVGRQTVVEGRLMLQAAF
jgi:Phosphate-selective porin O and P